jgi:hypothetical protein
VRNLFQGGTPNWPEQSLSTRIFNIDKPAIGFASAFDGLALTCWLHKDALLAALYREIDVHARDDIAMSPAAKEKAAAEMAQTLLNAEHQVCRLIDVALAQKLPVEFGDEDPAAILGVIPKVVPPSPQPGYQRQSWTVRH